MGTARRHLADLAAAYRCQLSRQIEVVPPIYAELIRPPGRVEEVHINVWDADMKARRAPDAHRSEHALAACTSIPSGDTSRGADHGPIFVSREYQGQHERAGRDGLTTPGRKYPYDLDDAVPDESGVPRCRFPPAS